MKTTSNQIKELMDMLKMMDSSIEEVSEYVKKSVSEYGLVFSIVDDISRFTKEQIEAFTSNIFISMYDKFKDKTSNIGYPENYDERANKMKENVLGLYDEVIDYKKLCKERDEMSIKIKEILDDYSSYVTSDEAKEKDKMILKDLKNRIENEQDEVAKKKLVDQLNTLEKAEKLEFLFERFDNISKKELQSIKDSFFDKRKAEYIINKYAYNMRKLRYNPDIFKSLLDIEANFLEKDYYCYNNLFLFSALRFLAYANLYSNNDSLFSQTLMLKITKLVYHKLDKDEENAIIEIIKRFDSKFDCVKDQFVEKNLTSPLCEYRVSMEKRRKQETLNNIENWFMDHDINLPSWYSYEEKVKYMKVMKEKLELKDWFDLYNIEYPHGASLECLREIKESYNPLKKNKEKSDENKESNDDISEKETVTEN